MRCFFGFFVLEVGDEDDKSSNAAAGRRGGAPVQSLIVGASCSSDVAHSGGGLPSLPPKESQKGKVINVVVFRPS